MNTSTKRTVKETKQNGLSVQDILLIGILLAAGAVLKFFVGSVVNFGMKPNFIIAMYCLIVLIIKPSFKHSAIIGLLSGVVCQFFPGTPYINIASELIGAIMMCFLCLLPLRIGKIDLHPTVATFISTITSGFAYTIIMYIAFYGGADITPTPIAIFMAIIFGTATINAVIVQILYIPLKLALKK
ncbi:MAG: hypothetical protein R3Y33_00615 [Clostridia bacterium]